MRKRAITKKEKLVCNSVLVYIIFLFISLSFSAGCTNIKEDVKRSYFNYENPYFVVSKHLDDINHQVIFDYEDAIKEFDNEIIDASTFVYDVRNVKDYNGPINYNNKPQNTSNLIYGLQAARLISSSSNLVSSFELLYGEMPKKADEILIPKYIFDSLCEYGYYNHNTKVTINGDDIKKDPTKILNLPYSYSSLIEGNLKISGVINIPYNESYKDILLQNTNVDWTNYLKNYSISQIYNEFNFLIDTYQGALIVTDEYLELEQNSFIPLPNGKKAKKVCVSMLIDINKIVDRKKELVDKYYYDDSREVYDKFVLYDRYRNDYLEFWNERFRILSNYYIGFASLVFVILLLSNITGIIYTFKTYKRRNEEPIKSIQETKPSKNKLIKSIGFDILGFATFLLFGFIHNYFIVSPNVGTLTIRVSPSYIFFVGEVCIFIAFIAFKYLVYPKIRKYIVDLD